MKATLPQWFRPALLILPFLLLAVAIAQVGTRRSHADSITYFPGKYCYKTGAISCPTCPTGTGGTTCQYLVPAAWSEGYCYTYSYLDNGCYATVGFTCGSQLTCGTGVGTGYNCSTPNVCQ